MRNTIETHPSQSATHPNRTGSNIHSRKGGKGSSIDLSGNLKEDIDKVIDIKSVKDRNIVIHQVSGEGGEHSEKITSSRRNISSASIALPGIDDENSPSKGLNKANRRSASTIICSTMTASLVLVLQRIMRAVSRIHCMNSTRLVVLIVLSLQNSLFTVLRRYSQGILREKYSTYECLLLGEIIKIIFSAYMIRSQLFVDQQNQREAKRAETSSLLSTPGSSSTAGSHSFEETVTASVGIKSIIDSEFAEESIHERKHLEAVFSERIRFVVNSSGKMFGLALIYGAMNILSFVSLKNIGAGMFTIFAQCKILTTATFSCWILGRQYSYTKWRALAALMAGVLLFSEPIWSKQDAFKSTNDNANTFIGTIAVITEVTLSGFASIYFEKVVKLDPLPLSIWERNFQLALGSFPVYLGFIAWSGGGEAGILGGWSWMGLVVASLGAAGGILVALSIKYGDAILKTLATTAAIVLSSVLDYTFLNGPLSPTMCIAAFQVIIAIANYSFDATMDEPVMSLSSPTSLLAERSITPRKDVPEKNSIVAEDGLAMTGVKKQMI